MKSLYIYGAGGHAREVAFLVEEINAARQETAHEIAGFLSDDKSSHGSISGKYRVLGGIDILEEAEEPVSCVIGIGNPAVIRELRDRLLNIPGLEFPNLIHPSTIMDWSRAELGEGNTICAGNIFTTDIRIGSFNVFNRSCSLGHDLEVGDCCVINPGCNVSGSVVLEGENLLGTGVTILQGLRIHKAAIVGAGAVVVRDVAAGMTVVGVPARPLR